MPEAAGRFIDLAGRFIDLALALDGMIIPILSRTGDGRIEEMDGLRNAIPDQTWKYKTENRPVVKEVESKEPNNSLVEFKYNGQIGEKLDKMIERCLAVA